MIGEYGRENFRDKNKWIKKNIATTNKINKKKKKTDGSTIILNGIFNFYVFIPQRVIHLEEQ